MKKLIALSLLIFLNGCEGQPKAMQDNIIFSLTALVILLALFFIMREAILWYYKINHSLKVQKAILFMLKKIFEQNGKLDKDQEEEIQKIIKRNDYDTDPLSKQKDQ